MQKKQTNNLLIALEEVIHPFKPRTLGKCQLPHKEIELSLLSLLPTTKTIMLSALPYL